ncbi:MAG: hypothetical protein NDJ24_07585 [Alphaproteobacteria bacterium]|nr:hypothetical protein [Alphaproteobacteria bacterium]
MRYDHFDRYWVESLGGDHSEFIYNKEQITLPLPPVLSDESRFEMEVYARFMRHLRHVPNSRMEIKILSAIQFTADIMDHGDALIAKTLVDLGLRAPRKAFPITFLDFADKSVQRRHYAGGSVPPPAVLALKEHWDHIGENRFATAGRAHYAVFNENMYVRA